VRRGGRAFCVVRVGGVVRVSAASEITDDCSVEPCAAAGMVGKGVVRSGGAQNREYHRSALTGNESTNRNEPEVSAWRIRSRRFAGSRPPGVLRMGCDCRTEVKPVRAGRRQRGRRGSARKGR